MSNKGEDNGYNRKKDINLSTALVMRSLGTMTKEKIDSIVKCNEYYFHSNNMPMYAAFPGKHVEAYNCNSFTHGLLNASGIGCPDLNAEQKSRGYKFPGLNKPVPKSYFGVSE